MRAVVTGAASGFGRATAEALLAAGYDVWGADETPAWTDGWPAGFRGAMLDVRDEAAVNTFAASVGPVDVVVNNAGYAAFGTQEELPLDVVRDLFDVNVLGPARVTRAFLPSLRAQRGVMVALSSVAGRMVFPESGFYAATKHAVEAMCEALAQEAGPAGVRVRLVEPGSFDTGFSTRAAASSPDPGPESPYVGLRATWGARKSEVLASAQPAAWVAAAVLGSLLDPAPYLRVPVGEDGVRILALLDALGQAAWSGLALQRAGVPNDAFPDPDVVLAAGPDAPGWTLAQAAHRARFLGHWEVSPSGREALRLLRASPPSSEPSS